MNGLWQVKGSLGQMLRWRVCVGPERPAPNRVHGDSYRPCTCALEARCHQLGARLGPGHPESCLQVGVGL